MKFSIGQKVWVKGTGEEVIILKSLSTKVVEVILDEEVQIRHLKELTPINPEEVATLRLDKEPNQRAAVKKKEGASSALSFYFQPVSGLINREELTALKIYFLNETGQSVLLHYCCRLKGKIYFEDELMVDSKKNKPFLHELDFVLMNDQPVFEYAIQLVKGQVNWSKQVGFYRKDSFKLKPKRLFQYLSKMKIDKADGFSILLLHQEDFRKEMNLRPKEKEPPKKPTSTSSKTGAIRPSFKKPKVRKPKQISILKDNAIEVDLHAEALGMPTDGLSNFEILTRQLEKLQEAINYALQRGSSSLIVIHGVGTGKLKQEVLSYLKSLSAVDFFQSGWRPAYGQGATEVFFK